MPRKRRRPIGAWCLGLRCHRGCRAHRGVWRVGPLKLTPVAVFCLGYAAAAPEPVVHERPRIVWALTGRLAFAHRWDAENVARGAQHALGGAGDGHQPLVITALCDELQANRHAHTVEADRQRHRT
jgi:hypothetical protein